MTTEISVMYGSEKVKWLKPSVRALYGWFKRWQVTRKKYSAADLYNPADF